MRSNGLQIIILAAGQGKRMQSDLPKVLHPVAGRPMLAHVIDCAKSVSPDALFVVVGHGGEKVRSEFTDNSIKWCMQHEQLGTGHAVQQALPQIPDNQNVLVLYGDVPLLTSKTLASLIDKVAKNDLVLLSSILDDPSGYGRIVRDNYKKVLRIIEHKDADSQALNINEINTGILAANSTLLKEWLLRVDNNNVQQEYYLTDCIELAVNSGCNVDAIVCDNEDEIIGINNKRQLANAERTFQSRIAECLMEEGVTLIDPLRIDVRGNIVAGKGVEIDVNCIFVGSNIIEDNVKIEANNIFINAKIKSDTCIHPNCHIENAVIGANCEIGPFARIRPDTVLSENVKVGNFVEVKKSNISSGSKVNHLSYIGDSDLGKNVNIGAGTITCNYDGANKHRTSIGNNVFIGSDTQIVAPVRIGDGATIGAGSTITKDTPENKLTLSRAKQTSIDNWQRPKKK